MAPRAAALVVVLFFAAGASAQPTSVSLVQLIANPERHEGQVVQVTGYCSLEFEGHAVYLHQDDERYGHTRNAVWLDVTEDLLRSAKVKKTHCIVQGVFSAKNKGHMSLFSGGLSKIERYAPWPPYRVPKQRP